MNVPLAAEPIAHIGFLTITNSLIDAWIVTIFLIIIAALLRRRRAAVPTGLQNVAEYCLEGMLAVCDTVTGDRSRSKKFLPVIGTLFIFILFNNWLGQLPGTGTIGLWHMVDGHAELVPLFRPATSDLNLTAALGIFAILFTHLAGMYVLGVFRHIGKFIQIGNVARSFKKGPIAVLTACVEFVVGLIEMVTEIAKAVSLSLRLFGNIFAGEVLITVMLSLVAFIIPLPFQALELLVGIIQATVFAMLALVFLTLATDRPHGEEPFVEELEADAPGHQAHALTPAHSRSHG